MRIPPSVPTYSFPALLRVTGKAKPLENILAEMVASGVPLTLTRPGGNGVVEDMSAIDPSLTTEQGALSPPSPQPGTSYAGLSPAQRHAFIAWSRKPDTPAPRAYQQLYLANLEARLLESDYRHQAQEKLKELVSLPTWANEPSVHRAFILSCWIEQDGNQLGGWIGAHKLPGDLLSIALGQQALMGTPLTAPELGAAIERWALGDRIPADLLKLRLDSLTANLGQPPLDYALSLLDEQAKAPHPWRTTHRGLHLQIPQPDIQSTLESSLRELLVVQDVAANAGGSGIELASSLPLGQIDAGTEAASKTDSPSLEELGWRLILEFGSNRSEYFDYVLIQAQKLPGYSQLMDEDRRIVYRIIFRKSEMRRFWRLWDYVHGWTSTRVYLNGEELEKWKVWPYSQYLR